MPTWLQKSLLIAAISSVILGLGYYIALPYFQLEVARLRLVSSIKYMQTQASDRPFLRDCDTRGSATIEETQVLSYQLRFTSPNAYVIEAVCDRIGAPAIEVSAKSLPKGVVKTAGSGLSWPVARQDADVVFSDAAFTIASGQGSLTFHLTDELEVVAGAQQAAGIVPGPDAPATSCMGWSLQCCPDAGFVGVGPLQSKVTDCRERCFESCSGQPTALFFNTNPIIDPSTRSVTLVTPPYSLEVGYQLTNINADATVTINWGDGTTATGQLKDQLTHAFSCAAQRCEYRVTLSTQEALAGPTSIDVVVVPQ